MRGLRLLCFALIWLIAETAALFMCLGLWVASGFGGRLRTEPYQARHYAVMGWFLNLLYRAADRHARAAGRGGRAGAHPGRAGRPAGPAGHRAQPARRAG